MNVQTSVEACSLYASIEMHCPLCRILVPAHTWHDCKKVAPQTAREKFAVGDRVELTNWNVRGGATRFGTVTGFGVDPALVKVRRDGTKNPEGWHMSRWGHAAAGAQS